MAIATGGQRAHNLSWVDLQMAILVKYVLPRAVILLVLGSLFQPAQAGQNTWTRSSSGLNGSGVILHVAVSPNFRADRTLFAAASSFSGGGPIFRSTDGGATWTLVFTDLPLEADDSGALMVSPTYETDRTIFVLASIVNGTLESTLAVSGDAGATWRYLKLSGVAPNGCYIGAVAVSPGFASDRTLLAGDYCGHLLRSTDGGETWALIYDSGQQILDLAFSPGYLQDRAVFLLTYDQLVHTVDGGATWSAAPLPKAIVTAFALSPGYAADRTIVVGGNLTSGPSLKAGVWKSTDAGLTWTGGDIGVPVPVSGGVHQVRIAPDFAHNQTIVAVTNGAGTYRSVDGGQSWSSVVIPITDPTNAAGLPRVPSARPAAQGPDRLPRIRRQALARPREEAPASQAVADPIAVAFSPDFANDHLLFTGTTNGLFSSMDGGRTWTERKEGLTAVNVWAIHVSPAYALDTTIFAETDSGLFKSTDGGASWNRKRGPSRVGLSPGYATDATVFATDGTSLYLSKDRGESWTLTAKDFVPDSLDAFGLKVSPDYADDRILFVFGRGGVLRSMDGGATWAPCNNGLTNLDIAAFAVSPDWSHGKTLFAGTFAGRDGGVFRSKDGGASWQQLSSRVGVLESNSQVGDIAFSPSYAVDRTVFVAGTFLSQAIYRSDDGGDTWSTVSSMAGANVLAFSPSYLSDQVLFAGTGGSAGVLKSNDGGYSWVRLDAGYANRYIGSGAVAVKPGGSPTLLAGGESAGIWQYRFDELSVPSGASFAAGPLAKQAIVSIFGTNLGPATPQYMKLIPGGMRDTNLGVHVDQVDTNLGGTRVLFRYRIGYPYPDPIERGTVAAPLLYVSDHQVNAIVPADVEYGDMTEATVTVEYLGTEVGLARLPVRGSVPGLFTRSGSGTGAGAVLNLDYSVNAPGNPAARGSAVQLFGTGVELYSIGRPQDGEILPVLQGPLPWYWPGPDPAEPVTATIGGTPAEVLFAGCAPGMVSCVLQVNVRVPANAPTGDAVPVRIAHHGFYSQPGVTIAIK